MQVLNDNSVIEQSVYNTLKYFHTFKHPLVIHEIQKFMSVKTCKKTLTSVLDEMVSGNKIYMHDSMYMLEDNGSWVDKRSKGEVMADELMPKAVSAGRVVAMFPFVEGIYISGSLSKGYADKKSDLDFFIITKKQRLWICRTMLHIFKKFTFVVNEQHSFCMNYFIDESKLQLEEQNIFTATELTTLIPIYGDVAYEQLKSDNNSWVESLLPNNSWDNRKSVISSRKPFFRIVAERIFNVVAPRTLNSMLMNITDKKWRKKWKKKNYPQEDYELAMKTKWYVSKQHPLNYQKKALSCQ